MKGKKGFTLIELLAVIVIIAIIAVITVPVVLNIIEESKFGAAKDSALGYKDAVHKYYASRLSLDSNFKMVDSTYEIDSNGYLSDGTNTYEIQIDGKVPSSGYVQIERNVVKNACIGYDDYAVLISDGNISDTAKGECTSVSEIVAVGEEPLEVGTEYLFPYVSEGDNKEQTLEIVRSGYYKLEVWGAQGGSSTTTGGYGGYSSGYVRLTRGTILYINVGEQPTDLNGGYNGGGQAGTAYNARGGGGATHIALSNGTLDTFADNNEIDDILIVAGAGGGSLYCNGWNFGNGGHGGGKVGGEAYSLGSDSASNNGHGTGGTQETAGCIYRSSGLTTCSDFGASKELTTTHIGGGGGYYGGGIGILGSGGGGSGYVGYSDLNNGVMYYYGCTDDNSSGTKTISTTGSNKDSVNCPNGYSNSALSNCAKSGNGYAVIIYIGESLN